MGMTMTQKILAAHAGLPMVEAGQLIEAKLDQSFDFITELGFKVKKEKLYKTNKHVFIGRE